VDTRRGLVALERRFQQRCAVRLLLGHRTGAALPLLIICTAASRRAGDCDHNRQHRHDRQPGRLAKKDTWRHAQGVRPPSEGRLLLSVHVGTSSPRRRTSRSRSNLGLLCWQGSRRGGTSGRGRRTGSRTATGWQAHLIPARRLWSPPLGGPGRAPGSASVAPRVKSSPRGAPRERHGPRARGWRVRPRSPSGGRRRASRMRMMRGRMPLVGSYGTGLV
jgi:hypothetical protein